MADPGPDVESRIVAALLPAPAEAAGPAARAEDAQVTAPVAADGAVDVAGAEHAVSAFEGLRRVAAGLGVAAAVHAVVGFFWPWVLGVSGGLMLVIALSWLDQPGDRRRWTALPVGCGVALLAGVAATLLLPRGGDAFASQLTIAALAALPAGQAYALVTRRRSRRARRGTG